MRVRDREGLAVVGDDEGVIDIFGRFLVSIMGNVWVLNFVMFEMDSFSFCFV